MTDVSSRTRYGPAPSQLRHGDASGDVAPPPDGARTRTALLVGWLLTAVVAALLAVALGGAAPEAPLPGLPDPGPVPGWSLPLLRLAGHGAALTVVGALLVPLLSGARLRRGLVVAAAAGWAALTVASLLLSLSEVVASPVSAVLTEDLLRFYGLEVPQGRALVQSAGLALVVAAAAPAARGRTGAALLLLVALGALVPPLLEGHAAGLDQHRLAQAALVLHVLPAVVWVAGLSALALLRADASLAAAAARFSTLALLCAVAVALSGLVSSWLRLEGPSQLVTTGYGVLLSLKAGAFVLLVAAGARHRLRTLPDLRAGRPEAFRRLAGGELAVMAGVYGVAVALSRTPVG